MLEVNTGNLCSSPKGAWFELPGLAAVRVEPPSSRHLFVNCSLQIATSCRGWSGCFVVKFDYSGGLGRVSFPIPFTPKFPFSPLHRRRFVCRLEVQTAEPQGKVFLFFDSCLFRETSRWSFAKFEFYLFSRISWEPARYRDPKG